MRSLSDRRRLQIFRRARKEITFADAHQKGFQILVRTSDSRCHHPRLERSSVSRRKLIMYALSEGGVQRCTAIAALKVWAAILSDQLAERKSGLCQGDSVQGIVYMLRGRVKMVGNFRSSDLSRRAAPPVR